MHIGNVYAMLAAWLSAKSQTDPATGWHGCVVLRIEDVDRPRAVKDADRWIMDDLHWLGLDWSGGPVYQSQRTDLYEQALRALRSFALQKGARMPVPSAPSLPTVETEQPDAIGSVPLIYPCFCSRADIRAASAPQEGDRFLIYPGTCRRLLAERPGEVRKRLEEGRRHSLRIAVPQAGAEGQGAGGGSSVVTFADRVFGPQRFDLAREVGDTVVRRSDGLFSYQLAVVVDDLLMGVNDVARGRDLLRSTALQMWIRQALVASGFGGVADGSAGGSASGFPDLGRAGRSVDCADCSAGGKGGKDGKEEVPPVGAREPASPSAPAYAHIPLIDDCSGARLAKRRNSLDLGELRSAGASPEQVVGYCAWLLGLRRGKRQSGPVAMSADEALGLFSWGAVRQDLRDRPLPGDVLAEVLSVR